MDRDELERFARRLRQRSALPPRAKPKLRIGLPLISAARRYREALDAADAARRELVAEALENSSDSQAALDAVNHLAERFRLPSFTEGDVGE